MSVLRAVLVAATPVVAVALAVVGSAHADGDPASDFLITDSVFAPFDAHLSSAHVAQLRQLVSEANARGLPIRVALIGTRYDMGSVLVLWQKPQPYARFLGQELAGFYRGRLLVVMPNGYGVSMNGMSLPAAQSALASLPVPSAQGDLAAAGIAAVRQLAQRKGIRLAVPSPPRTAAQHNHDRLLIGVGIGAVVLIGLAVAVIRRRGLPPKKAR